MKLFLKKRIFPIAMIIAALTTSVPSPSLAEEDPKCPKNDFKTALQYCETKTDFDTADLEMSIWDNYNQAVCCMDIGLNEFAYDKVISFLDTFDKENKEHKNNVVKRDAFNRLLSLRDYLSSETGRGNNIGIGKGRDVSESTAWEQVKADHAKAHRLMEQGKYQDAIKSLEKWSDFDCAGDNSDVIYSYEMARCEHIVGDALVELAAAYFSSNDSQKVVDAMDILMRVIKNFPDSKMIAKREMTLFLFSQLRIAEAKSVAESMLFDDPDNSDALEMAGMTQLAAGDYDKSISHFSKALTSDNTLFLSNLYLGGAYLMKEEYATASRLFLIAGSLNPVDPRPSTMRAYSRMNEADSTLKKGDLNYKRKMRHILNEFLGAKRVVERAKKPKIGTKATDEQSLTYKSADRQLSSMDELCAELAIKAGMPYLAMSCLTESIIADDNPSSKKNKRAILKRIWIDETSPSLVEYWLHPPSGVFECHVEVFHILIFFATVLALFLLVCALCCHVLMVLFMSLKKATPDETANQSASKRHVVPPNAALTAMLMGALILYLYSYKMNSVSFENISMGFKDCPVAGIEFSPPDLLTDTYPKTKSDTNQTTAKEQLK